MPAPLNSSDSSSRPVTSYGIKEPPGNLKCPFDSKNRRYFSRRSRTFITALKGTSRGTNSNSQPKPGSGMSLIQQVRYRLTPAGLSQLATRVARSASTWRWTRKSEFHPTSASRPFPQCSLQIGNQMDGLELLFWVFEIIFTLLSEGQFYVASSDRGASRNDSVSFSSRTTFTPYRPARRRPAP